MIDQLTALRTTNGQPATKRHIWTPDGWSTESYSAGSHFAWSITEVDGIHSLSQRLREIEGHPEWFVIRGHPAREAKYLRRTYHNKDQSIPPGFEPVDRQWLCIDIDRLPAPEGDVDRLAYAIGQLPDAFHGVSTHWQWSSSAGISDDGRIQLHLWYWLDRPVSGFSLRDWVKEIPYVDAMLYNPVQPHFTAAPIIEGAPDPIQQRSGLLPGRDELVLPDNVVDLATWLAQWRKERAKERSRQRRASTKKRDPRSPELKRRYVQSALYSACDEIQSAPAGDRHRTVFSQSAAVGELLHTGHIEEGEAIAHLEAAALAVLTQEGRQREAIRTVSDGLEHGRKNPRDISHVGIEDMARDDEGWMENHQPITCKNFERTSTGCAHYLDFGGCALAAEFLCVEWLKVNPVKVRAEGDTRPPRSHWSENDR